MPAPTLDVRADDREGADLDVGGELRARHRPARWMDPRHRVRPALASSCPACASPPSARPPRRSRRRPSPARRTCRCRARGAAPRTSRTSWSPGTHLAAEARIVDAGEEDQRLPSRRAHGPRSVQARIDASLRQRLDHQHARHHRVVRESGPAKNGSFIVTFLIAADRLARLERDAPDRPAGTDSGAAGSRMISSMSMLPVACRVIGPPRRHRVRVARAAPRASLLQSAQPRSSSSRQPCA